MREGPESAEGAKIPEAGSGGRRVLEAGCGRFRRPQGAKMLEAGCRRVLRPRRAPRCQKQGAAGS